MLTTQLFYYGIFIRYCYILPLTTICRNLNNNAIKRVLATHFEDNPLAGTLNFASNDIAFIEDGTFDHVTTAVSMWVLLLLSFLLGVVLILGQHHEPTHTGHINI